ncbi:hypothetical protein ACVWYH_005609 [Bradyrhizobium sp. GM24.11]
MYVLYTSVHEPALSLTAYSEVVTSGLFQQALGTTLLVIAGIVLDIERELLADHTAGT